MKYGLLFSDIVAWVVGLIILLASVITLQKGMVHWISGSKTTGMAMALMGLFLFLQVRKFTLSKAYDQMLASATNAIPRAIFVTICLFCMVWVATMILNTRPEDIFGLSTMVPWLFSPALLLVVGLCFCLAFIAPGVAFGPYRSRQSGHNDLPANDSDPSHYYAAPDASIQIATQRIYARMPYLKMRQSVPLRSRPVANVAIRIIYYIAVLILAVSILALLFSKTHASIDYLEDTKLMVFPLTLVIFLGCYLPYNYGTRFIPDTGEILFRPKHKLINAVFLMGIGYGFAHLPIHYTVPWIYNMALADETVELAYTVDERVSYKGCGSGLSFAYIEDASKSFHVCGVDPSLRARANTDDVILIRGPVSYFGHTAETLRIGL